MKLLLKSSMTLTVAMCAWSLTIAPEFPHLPGLVNNAEAIVGRPVSPVSVAGVARRTTRRVAYTSAASAQQQQAAQAQQAPAPAPAPAPEPQQAAAPPAGTVVTALPAGCTSTVIDGANLFNCSGVLYQPTFQSNNLVYVVK